MNWDDLVPALEAVSRELSLEVQRTFDYFASTAESERIGRIVLSGGCAKLAGIDEFSPHPGGSRWSWPARSPRGTTRPAVLDEELERPTACSPSRWASGCGRPGTRTA